MKEKFRVKKHQEFQEIINSKKFEKNSNYAIYFRSNEFGYSRIGISASKKLGNAVQRVKIRRQVRAMLRELWGLDIPLDLVIIVRNGYKIENYNESLNKLKDLLDKIIRRLTIKKQ
ncbi:MAG: ribonuclease P protein component [Bacilli bacterium]